MSEMEPVKAQLVEQETMANLVTKTEYDVQITTAKKFPRSVKDFITRGTTLVTMNEQMAVGCIYALPRKKDGKDIVIEGPSARFAEIMLHAWGNCRAAARIVNEDNKFVTAQGVCHDLESNTLIAYEVRRRITTKQGYKFNDDMIGMTANAASSIAIRNAILKVVPKVFWQPIYDAARHVAMGDSKTLNSRVNDAILFMQKFGVSEEKILQKLEVKGVEDINLDHLVILRGIATALKDGEVTVEALFPELKTEAEPASKTDSLKAKLKAQKESQQPTNDEEKNATTSDSE